MPRETNPNFMAGVPELLILRLLQDREMYGYEVVQAIRFQTDERVSAGAGVIYPVLHGLEHDGALKSRSKTVNGRERIYYSLTAKGTRRLKEISEEFTSLSDAIQAVLKGNVRAGTV